jgi:DNA-binding transcriptional LysR family regulator
MQLQQLAYAVAVAEEHHFTRAAARLHVAQPSLSRQVRLLEGELGVELFHRGPGQSRVELTPEGEMLMPFIRRVLADVAATTSEAKSLAGLTSGRLSIGATPSLATRFLPGALAQFHARYPGIELFVVEAGSRQLVPRVAEGELDLALVVLPVADPLVATTEMFEDRLVLAVAPDHPLAERRRIRVTSLAGLPLVMFREGYDLRASTMAACRQAGVEPQLITQGGEMDGVLAMVAAGIGAAVVPDIAVPTDGSLRSLTFVNPGLSRTIALARRRDRPLSRPAQALSAILADMRF